MREIAEVEAFAGGIVGAEEALHAFAEILRADEKRLGVFSARLNQTDSGARWERGEEVFVVRGGEVLAAVEIEHEVRILRGEEEQVDSR